MNTIKSPPLEPEVLDRVVQLLVDAARPRRIILFGSYARGDQTPGSELDLLVVEDEVPDPAGEVVRLRRALLPIHMTIDVLVYSANDLEIRGRWPGTTVHYALREGRQVYADQ